MAALEGGCGGGGSSTASIATSSRSCASCGAIKVATIPKRAAAIASAASRLSEPAGSADRNQPDTGRASDAISEARGGSEAKCQLVWSPITLKIADRARRAL
jgi:hypothetical protein